MEYNRNGKSGVGTAVLVTCSVMALIIGLFAGVFMMFRAAKQDREAEALKASASPAQIAETTPAQIAETTSAQELPTPAVQEQDAVTVESEKTSTPSAGFAYDGQYTRAQVVELCAPSVVGIDATFETTVSYWGRQETYEQQGSGSGVILTADGYIATCAHVVNTAKAITVTLNDDASFTAEIVGVDTRNDLAIIKIEAENLVPATLGDSDMLTVGEDVIAIGNPLGELRGTATGGIISAVRRSITVENTEMELVQTDAAISPGNSGGGLFNASGRLIGIVNAKVSDTSAEGLGFAIPVNSVVKEINDLLHYGYVTGRAYLGVYTQNVTLTSGYGYYSYGGTRCVQITEIVPGSPAEAAGLKAGDLILAIDGKTVSSNDDLSDLIAGYNAGDTAKLTVRRDSERSEISVVFGEYVPES